MTSQVEKKILIIYADYSSDICPNEEIEKSDDVQKYLQEGFSVIHVLASDEITENKFHSFNEKHYLIQRPNRGYDFGSWEAALNFSSVISKFDYLLFTNSSLLGPLDTPNQFIESLFNLKSDVKGAVESFQIEPHFQSYMWGIENHDKILNLIHKFLKPFATAPADRELTILNGELKFPKYLSENGLTYKTIFPAGSLCPYEKNPSLDSPIRLFSSGFPYIKKTLMNSKEFLSQNRDELLKIIPHIDL